MQFSTNTLFPSLTFVICLSLVAALSAEPGSATPPQTLSIAGATGSARLNPWIVDSPADYSGHYVSESVTDGWVEMLITIRTVGKGTAARWIVDVYERDDRQGPEKEDRDFKNRPLTAQPEPHFQLADNGPSMFFAKRISRGPKGAFLKPVLVSADGSCFRLDPTVPKTVVLSGKEISASFRPWKVSQPTTYAGHYVSISASEGSCDLDITVNRQPESRVPWRFDTACVRKTPGKEDSDYEYGKRPLWNTEWPHFDAYDTYLFVNFQDRRSLNAAPAHALITQKGEVLIKRN